MRTGQKAQTAAINLKGLVCGKFHGEIGHSFTVTFFDRVRDCIFIKTHNVFFLHEGAS